MGDYLLTLVKNKKNLLKHEFLYISGIDKSWKVGILEVSLPVASVLKKKQAFRYTIGDKDKVIYIGTQNSDHFLPEALFRLNYLYLFLKCEGLEFENGYVAGRKIQYKPNKINGKVYKLIIHDDDHIKMLGFDPFKFKKFNENWNESLDNQWLTADKLPSNLIEDQVFLIKSNLLTPRFEDSSIDHVVAIGHFNYTDTDADHNKVITFLKPIYLSVEMDNPILLKFLITDSGGNEIDFPDNMIELKIHLYKDEAN